MNTSPLNYFCKANRATVLYTDMDWNISWILFLHGKLPQGEIVPSLLESMVLLIFYLLFFLLCPVVVELLNNQRKQKYSRLWHLCMSGITPLVFFATLVEAERWIKGEWDFDNAVQLHFILWRLFRLNYCVKTEQQQLHPAIRIHVPYLISLLWWTYDPLYYRVSGGFGSRVCEELTLCTIFPCRQTIKCNHCIHSA